MSLDSSIRSMIGMRSPRNAAAAGGDAAGRSRSGRVVALEGHLDHVQGRTIVGWAYDPQAPDAAVLVEVSAAGARLVALADVERPDLRDAGKGNGRHGFVVTLERELVTGELVQASFVRSGAALLGSPTTVNAISALRQDGRRTRRHLVEAEVTRAALELPTPEVTDDGRGSSPVRVPPYATRARLDTLVETASPGADPQGLVSRYLEFQVARHRGDDTPSLTAGFNNRMKALLWYLKGGGSPSPLLLSRSQIGFLNAPATVLGAPEELSVAAYSFIVDAFGPDRNLADPTDLVDGVYWWCLERSRRIAPDGALITPAQTRLLSGADIVDAGLAFPLNRFARHRHARHSAMHAFDLSSEVDRAAYVGVLALEALRDPVLFRFLPRRALQALRAPSSEGDGTVFGQLISIASGEGEGALAADRVRPRLEARLAELIGSTPPNPRGPSLGTAAGSVPRTAPRAALPSAERSFRPELEAGIAVIGPVRASSGLGQATRASTRVLQAAGLAPVVHEFNGNDPAPKESTSVHVEPPRSPRAVNLLHVNADTVPIALATMPQAVWDRSYNIGFFFWELDKVPAAHRLALATLDEIWTASEYGREIYARCADIPVHNVGMAVDGLPAVEPVSRAEFGIPAEDFVFLATFDSFSFIERKNPLGLIAAFREAFPETGDDRVSLVVKTQNRTDVFDPHQVAIWQEVDRIVDRDPRIQVIDLTLGYGQLLGLKAAADCYVSLHRSEGFGFGLIEAMQLKRPVVATGYSGNMEFCSAETAFLVDYELIAPAPPEYIFVPRGSLWADPDTASAARAMRDVRRDRAAAAAKVEAAFANVRDNFSAAAIAKRYRRRLDEIAAGIDTFPLPSRP